MIAMISNGVISISGTTFSGNIIENMIFQTYKQIMMDVSYDDCTYKHKVILRRANLILH